MRKFIHTIRRYLKDTSGVNAIIFAMVLPALFAAGGLAVDLANAYNVKNKLSQALDKAALATANSVGTEAELTQIAINFFEANFRAEGLGVAATPVVTFTEDTVVVSASANVNTYFIGIFGSDDLTVTAESEVTRELSGIEVAMVLDVTGSMAGDNIVALRSASTSFFDILFSRITDPELLRIGLVPYSSSVNVGPYGLGENPDGSFYDTPFVDRPETDQFLNPEDIDYHPTENLEWRGCVLAEPNPDDTLDDTRSGFQMYRYPRECTRVRFGQCTRVRIDPNRNCPTTPVVPLTNNRTQLQATIDALPTRGHTYGNFGMLWGWRLISPEPPFTEGVAYDDPRWEKAVIMMTDGQNTIHPFYGAYGLSSQSDLTTAAQNSRFVEICENMKQRGILIYTITFQSNVPESTRDFYRQCATSPTLYEHAPNDERLQEIFEGIANQLSRLHISR